MARDDDDRRYRGGKKVMNTDDALTRGVTGRRAKQASWASRVRDLAKTHGSENARQQLGVSKSTWRAWINGRRGPNKANAARLRSAHDSADVRRSMVSSRRAQKMAQNGVHIRFSGSIGPGGDDRYMRFRQISWNFSPAAADRIMTAFTDHGPEAARQEVLQAMADEYFGSTTATAEDITELRMTPRERSGGPAGAGGFDDFDE